MTSGELVRGRCRATNLCDYCRALYLVETTEALWLDATSHEAPSLLVVLGTRTASASPKPFYRGREQVIKALRRRWPVEYASIVEFTTGKGTRSGGARRPHWNLMLKGVGEDHVGQVGDVVRRIWCQHVDAVPRAQYVAPIRDAGGLGNYLADHFFAEAKGQTPPRGWTGQRFNASLHYFAPWSRSEARYRARRSLGLKRELWRLRREGVPAEQALALATTALELGEAKAWDLVDVVPARFDAAGEPDWSQLEVLGLVADRSAW